MMVTDLASNKKHQLLVLAEPIASREAVQFRFVSTLADNLKEWFAVTIASSFVEPTAKKSLEERGIAVISPGRDPYFGNRLFLKFGQRSEATLWGEAWLREALLSSNRRLLRNLLRNYNFDLVINTTNTAALASTVWWAQGPPLHVTLASMNGGGLLPSLLGRVLAPMICLLDRRLTDRLHSRSKECVAASSYVRQYYEAHGYHVADTLLNLADFSEFHPVPRKTKARYVLAYIGKETELDTLARIAEKGVRVVAFGDKLIPGIRLSRLPERFDFRGRVPTGELVALYSNAEFTVFPFTNEPLGYVPIESMACGTPVLTYGKEGPGETVINEESGWLVKDQQAFVEAATNLWVGFDTERFRRAALNRASQLGPKMQVRRLVSLLQNGGVADLAQSLAHR